MHVTDYLGISVITRQADRLGGGFCKWWYVPKEWVEDWPPVDPLTQHYLYEPLLVTDRQWLGPVQVPDRQVGWLQTMEVSKAGVFYKQKTTGYLPGNSAANIANLQNHANHQYIVIGQLRTGGFLVVGSPVSALSIDDEMGSGTGGPDTPGTKFTLTGESISKCIMLPEFAASVGERLVFMMEDGLTPFENEDGGGVQFETE